MAITKVTSGLISADASSIDLNIDAGTLYLDVSENRVGIGTSSPASKLHINLGTDKNIRFQGDIGEIGSVAGFQAVNDAGSALGSFGIRASDIRFATGSSERLRIDSSGNVLVGKTSSDTLGTAGHELHNSGMAHHTRATGTVLYLNRTGNDGNIIDLRKDNTTVGSIGTYSSDRLFIGAGDTNITFKPSDDILYPSTSTGFARDATISFGDSGARFKDLYLSGIVNPSDITTFTNAYSATVANGAFVYIGSGGSITCGVNSTASRTPMSFRNPNGEVGTITTSGSSTSYNTSSDYRLKENVVEMTGALDRVKQLQPKRFNFIADADTTVDGFLAHEVQDIVPEAIHGEKDAVKEEEYEITPAVLDDDGNVVTEAEMGKREVPEYQGIDQSKLVPLLTKAIQEQQTIIDNLKTRIETLENA